MTGKIITVTPNTAIDFHIEIEALASQDNIQAGNSIEFACGKGVNVAKAITSLDRPVTCLGFVGHQSMPVFKAIHSPLLQTDFTACEGKTRTNITLINSLENRETHIRTSGFKVTTDDCQKLVKKLESYTLAGDIVILSGSLPNGAPENFYQTLIELCHRQSAIPFLDSSGQGLQAGLAARPFLIKPNQQELEAIMGQSLPDEKSIVEAARSIVDQGIKWVYVSRGEKGVIAVSNDRVLSAGADKLPSKIISHIGCGDAMLAGLAVSVLKEDKWVDTIKTGVSCGVANLFSMEPGRFSKPLQENIFTDHIRSEIFNLKIN